MREATLSYDARCVSSCRRAKTSIVEKCESAMCEFQKSNLDCANFGFEVQRVRISEFSPMKKMDPRDFGVIPAMSGVVSS